MALPTKKRTRRRHFSLYFVIIGCACANWNVALLFAQKVEWIRRRVRASSSPEIASNFNSTAESQGYQHLPDFFTEQVPWETLLQRNNILTVYTGCSIATWTYSRLPPTHREKKSLTDDCGYYNAEKGWKERDITPKTVSQIQPGDSIYVELMKLDAFARRLLPRIQVDFVLIAGQNHLMPLKPEPIRPPYGPRTFAMIVENPHVTHWFMMNLDKHAYDPFHPKVWVARNM
jgi:hypothetical protein